MRNVFEHGMQPLADFWKTRKDQDAVVRRFLYQAIDDIKYMLQFVHIFRQRGVRVVGLVKLLTPNMLAHDRAAQWAVVVTAVAPF